MIVLDVNPTKTWLHREVLAKGFVGGEALRNDVRCIKNGQHRWVIHLRGDLREDVARLADQVGFDLETKRQTAFVASFGDLAELVANLIEMVFGGRALGVVEREAANEFCSESFGAVARGADIVLEVLVERDITIASAVVDVEQLNFSDR